MPEVIDMNGLAALERRVARDLELLCQPAANWVVPRSGPGGAPVCDVVIVGAGMCGLAAAFSLRRLGVHNLRILDAGEAGREGPWLTFARMRTLRSPKVLTGPALGLPNLTFRAWFEAQYGSEAWEALGKIPRPQWMDYLRWYRKVLALPVENGVRVERIGPAADGLLTLEAQGPVGAETLLARKVVLATGRDGLGGPFVPRFMEGVPRRFWAHSADEIDFAGLAGRRVGVVGAGASAMDNAGMALEAGAGSLVMFVRRPFLPRVNKLTGSGHPGFTFGYPDLDDAWRWRFLRYAMAEQVPPPRHSVQRVSRHPQARLRLGTPVEAVRVEGGDLVVTTPGEETRLDFLILATGFGVDIPQRPEIAAHEPAILRWKDRYRPPAEEAMAELGEFPYLGRSFEFLERRPGEAPFLADLHCFNYAATLSLGKVSGDIPAVSVGARWLAEGIVSRLFRADLEGHWEALQRYDVAELQGDEWPEPESTPEPSPQRERR